MAQQISPFIEAKYGWGYGADNWDAGMDENLLKFSFMFDGRVDGVIASLPTAVNGQSYFLTTDNRFYFAVGTTWYSSPCPQYFVFKIKSTGDYYQFDGSSAVQIDSPAQAESRFTSIEATLSSLGTAAFEDVADLATQAELDIASAQANAYTDALRDDLADDSDPAKGAAIVGRGVVAVDSIADLIALPAVARRADLRYLVKGYYAGGSSGGGAFYWNPTSTDSDNAITVFEVAGVPSGRFVREPVGYVTPEMAGALEAPSISTDALTSALTYCMTNHVPLLAAGDYVTDTVDLSAVTGALNIMLTGYLSLVDSASGALIDVSSAESIHIWGGGTINGNQVNQSSYLESLAVGSADSLIVSAVDFINSGKYAVSTQSRQFGYIEISGCRFTDAKLHDGTLGNSTAFVHLRGGNNVVVRNNEMEQQADPLVNQCRQPAGVVYIDTGATEASGKVVIEGNKLTNLGHHVAGNILSPIDFYSYANNIEIVGNELRKSRANPIRTSSGGTICVDRNDVLQDVPLIIDGGAAYSSASMVSIGLIDRGYATDENDVRAACMRANILKCIGVNCHGVTASSDSTTNVYRNISLDGNDILSEGSNSFFGVFSNSVQNVNIDGGRVEGFGMQVRLQGTDNKTVITDEGSAKLAVRSVRIVGGSIGVYCRNNVANLNVLIDDCDFRGQSSLSYSIRSANAARVINSELGGSAGDVSLLGQFWFKDNDPGVAAQPAGTATCTYYRLLDNVGISDAASA